MSVVASTTRWTGWDPRRASAPGSPTAAVGPPSAAAGVLYELLALAGRGFRPPQYLTVGPPADDEADETAAESGAYRPTWAVEYRGLAETAPSVTTPYAIYLLGVNPPGDATDTELDVFNDFYTNVHLREVAEQRHALRAERYERVRVLLAPAKGAPRFLAVYEFDEAGASRRRHVGPPYSAGPEVWQRHTTPWRLWYRRISP